VTRRRHLHRSMVIAMSAALFAVAASGSALAVSTATRNAPAGAVSPVSVAASAWTQAGATFATAQRALAPVSVTVPTVPAPKPAAKPTATKKAPASVTRAPSAPTPARAHRTAAPSTPTHQPAPVSGRRTIARYLDAPGSQKAIDRCNLVLWTHHPYWLAGHNYCGFQWMAYLTTGSLVTVSSGPARGTYRVTGHVRLNRQSGSLPHVSADLVLQTCVGSATGLTLLRRV